MADENYAGIGVNNTILAKNYKNCGYKVHKFGGSCLATTDSILAVARIIESQVKAGDLVVVSANGNVTNWLYSLIEGGIANGDILINYFRALQSGIEFSPQILQKIEADIDTVCQVVDKGGYSQSEILAHGEVWSALILSDVLNQKGCKAQAIDSCRCLKLNTETYQYPFDPTFADQALAKIYAEDNASIFVVTGFVALDEQLRKTTLGRNGSDFSATALGYLINSPSITIWTDVSGIYTADPKIIRNPLLVDNLTLCEAQALSELGANVLHEKTVLPLLSYKGQVNIKSFKQPEAAGTVVTQEIKSTDRVKTITFKPKLHKVCIYSIDELQARRIQKKLAEKSIASYVNGYDITQHKLTFYIEKSDVFTVTSTIKALQHYPSVLLSNMTLISLVGQNIRQNKRIIERFIRRLSAFDTQEIHYPNNSHSLSVVIDDHHAESLLQDLHTSFFYQEPTVPIVNGYDITQHKLTFYIEKSDVFTVTSTIKALQHYPSVLLSNMTLISLVGQNIRQNKRIIERFIRRLSAFDTQEIHYPNNSHSLSVVIDDHHAESLLQDLHTSFFYQEPTVPIVVLGYGNIGKKFVQLIEQGSARLGKQLNRSIQILAIANSKRFVSDQSGLDLSQVETLLTEGVDNSANQIFEWLEQYAGRELIVVDATASKNISERYKGFADNKWHIISANKIAASDKVFAREVESILVENRRIWKKNTTAGAGLPIQASIKNLHESGDQITEVSGIFSGSLSWLFSEFDGSKHFTDLLKVAQDNAFTEPDPREDLSGNDVIRKIRILAQQLGFEDSPEDFEPAIAEELLEGDLDRFWQKEEAINSYYQDLLKKAKSNDSLLRYIATLTPEKLSLRLEFIDKDDPFASLNPCDNVFQVVSAWYKDNPLIIQGPGAGREVTAGGVLNDLCDLLRGH